MVHSLTMHSHDDDQPGDARLLSALAAQHRDGALHLIGVTRAGLYRVRGLHDTPERVLTTDQARGWLAGYRMGLSSADLPRRSPAGRVPDEIRAVLVNPSLANACRVAIWAAMEYAGLTITDVAGRAGRTRNAVADALRFGARSGALSMQMAEAVMTATGQAWDVRWARLGAGDQPGTTAPARVRNTTTVIAPFGQAPPESAGVRRIRGLAIAHENGLIEWVEPTEPNAARRAVRHVVLRGPNRIILRDRVTLPWLAGLGDATAPDLGRAVTPPT